MYAVGKSCATTASLREGLSAPVKPAIWRSMLSSGLTKRTDLRCDVTFEAAKVAASKRNVAIAGQDRKERGFIYSGVSLCGTFSQVTKERQNPGQTRAIPRTDGKS